MPQDASHPTRLVSLNRHVLRAEPQENVRGKKKTEDPSEILLFGWMDARLEHLTKYVDQLQTVFPASAVIVVTSTSSFYFMSQRKREWILQPVLRLLEEATSDLDVFRGVLVYVFSNGGGFQFMTLRTILCKAQIAHSSSAADTRPMALVLDSVPGAHGLASSISVMAPTHPLLHILAVPLIALIYAIVFLLNLSAGNPPIFAQLRAALLAPDVLPFSGFGAPARAPRLYLYSEKDRIVPAQSVAAHAAEARARGYSVAVERFADSAHVSHARREPERYWAAVARVWTEAVKLE